MDIPTLTEIKECAAVALAGRQKLHKLHESHSKRIKEGSTRARSTTYHATTANIMNDIVEPAEKRLKEIIKEIQN